MAHERVLSETKDSQHGDGKVDSIQAEVAAAKTQETLLQDSTDRILDKQSNAESVDTPHTPLTTPMSLSVGADPWADPPAFSRDDGSGFHERRPAARENPWAEAEDITEDKVAHQDGLGAGDEETGTAIGHREAISSAASAGEGGRPRMAKSGSSNSHFPSGHDQQRFTLMHDERQGEYDLPRLGKPVARYWPLKAGFLQLNSGSYGTCPKPVMDYFKACEDRQEENCDAFRRLEMGDKLAEARLRVAKLLNVDSDQCVLIPNATTGTNAVLRDLVYQSGDAVIALSTTYGAVSDNLNYLVDTERMRGNELSIYCVDVPAAASNDVILDRFTSTIEKAQKDGKRCRIAIIDVVSSKPSLLLPWKQMVNIAREKQVLSLIDGAHGIGHVPIDLQEADPDFFVSNCHKWLYAHRSCAVFYVPLRNRHIQRSSLPTSFFYTRDPTAENNTWLQQWTGPGTLDLAPFLSVVAALDFREKLGGEARIMNYNHDLAVRGGLEIARILGTETLDATPDGSQTGAMATVRLPIIASRIFGGAARAPSDDAAAQAAAARFVARSEQWFFDALLLEFKTCIPTVAYEGKVWARISAQVFLDMDDFIYGARALRQLCERINQGDAPDFGSAAST